ncbi:MAG: MAPEG family protein [Sneathiella sp.]|nr:MAPEG family protein [Sneathiella sp.]
MEQVVVTPIYVALIALLMVYLSVRVAKGRGEHGVSLGDGGHEDLNVRVRGFGNLIEYAPMALLILLLLELQGMSALWLHVYGGVLVVLRVIHPFALFGQTKPTKMQRLGRMISAGGTALLIALGAIALLVP